MVCIPRIDVVNSETDYWISIAFIIIILLLILIVLWELFGLCKLSFSYRKDGVNETIEFNVICIASLITLILARWAQSWCYLLMKQEPNAQYSLRMFNFSNMMVEMSILFVTNIYLYGSIVWLRMIYDAEKKRKFQKLKSIIKRVGVYFLNPFLLGILLVMHILSPDNEMDNGRGPNKPFAQGTMAIVLIYSVLVQILFLYSSVKLFKYWESFELPSNKCVSNFKMWLYIIIFISFARILIFFIELIARFVDENSQCEEMPELSSAFMVIYTLFMSIMPISIFLLLFKFKFNARTLDESSHNMMLHHQSQIS